MNRDDEERREVYLRVWVTTTEEEDLADVADRVQRRVGKENDPLHLGSATMEHREDVIGEDRCHFLIGFRGGAKEVQERIDTVRRDEEVDKDMLQELEVDLPLIVERVSPDTPGKPMWPASSPPPAP
jgi:hypothetical protein